MVRLGELRLGLPLEDVVEVLPAMAHSPLPTAPPVILGVVNRRGEALPLLDLRTRLGGTPRAPHPDDHVVVCRVADRLVGVWLDHVDELAEITADELVDVDEVGDAEHVQGVALLSDGTVLVCDLRSFLSADEALRLDGALAEEH
jgi:purine-binding chemotaxis protein CheW